MEKSKSLSNIQMDQLARQFDSVEGLKAIGREATKTAKEASRKLVRPSPLKK